MKAGRELDALVAEKVFGFSTGFYDNGFSSDYLYYRETGPFKTEWKTVGSISGPALIQLHKLVPNYSTNISAAWEVVEEVGCNTVGLLYHDAYVQWQCVMDFGRSTFYDCDISVLGDTAPLAICLTALKAVGFA